MLALILTALLAALLAVGAAVLLTAIAPTTPPWLVRLLELTVLLVAFTALPGLL